MSQWLTTFAWTLMLIMLTCCTNNTSSEPTQAVEVQDDTGAEVVDSELSFNPKPVEPRSASAADIAFTNVIELLGVPELPVQGVAVTDYTGDGWPDVTLATALGVHLFKNENGTAFSYDNVRAGLSDVRITRAMSPVYADVDGDGDLDLLVTTNGDAERLFINTGQGVFDETSNAAGFTKHTFSFGGSFGDLDGDGDLDLFVAGGVPQLTQYPGAGEPRVPEEGEHYLLLNNPIGKRGTLNQYWRNDGAGKFTDVTVGSGLEGEPNDETFGALIFDVDRDGDMDVFTARDHLPPQLWLNDGKGQFQSSAGGYFPIKDTESLMGIDVGDFDGNGTLDIYGTRFDADMLVAQGNDPLAPFSPNRYPLLLTGEPDPTRIVTGWGCALVDLDNDRDVDVLTTSTFDYQYPNGTGPIRPGSMVVLKNVGLGYVIGGLVDVTSDVIAAENLIVHGWGLATGDFDKDGDVDVVVGVEDIVWSEFGQLETDYARHTQTLFLRNDSSTAKANGALSVQLKQPKTANPFAVGARVDVSVDGYSAIRFVFGGSPYLSTHSYVLHFGMNGVQRVDSVQVTWPDGTVEQYGCLSQGAHTLERGVTPPAPCD